MDTELKYTVNQISSGLGLLDCADFQLVASNQQLSDWLKYQKLPSSIESLLPGIKVARLQKVVTRNRKYRTKIALESDGFNLFVDFSFSKIQAKNGDDIILLEGIRDDNKHEIDALVSSYQETMENYKKQILEQKELTQEADKAKTMALSTMNEKLEEQVKERTKELEQAKSRLSHQANHDVLTGLANRRLFNDRLQHALELSHRRGKQLALFYLDLNKFKPINDTFGHRIGDELLVQVSQRLHQCIRESDTIARMGGDEFSIIVEDTSQENATIVAEKIISQLTQPFVIDGNELFISVSIGICIPEGKEDTGSRIIQAADAAMYKVKSSGREGFLFYSTNMIMDITEHRSIEIE